MRERYFDYAATSPISENCRQAMLPWLDERFGNAHSLHHWGLSAKAAVEDARERIAIALDLTDPSEIIFTSGATEACAIALNGFATGAMSPFEHSAVRTVGLNKGYDILVWSGLSYVGLDKDLGVEATMAVSNETGSLLPGADTKALRFCDVTQLIGKAQFEWQSMDAAAFSGHKIYGPTGIGALLHKDRFPVQPLVPGGGQEAGIRGGTLSVGPIVGLAAAIEDSLARLEEDAAHAQDLREVLLDSLSAVPNWQVNGPAGIPHILSLGFEGIVGETLVVEADQAGFGISAGAACSSTDTEPSPGLLGFGVEESMIPGTIRISFGRFNTRESAARLGQVLGESVKRIREMSKS